MGQAPIALVPIGRVAGGRAEPVDDDWGGARATIRLDPDRFGPDALRGLDAFSHVEVLTLLHRVDEAGVTSGARRPRGNPAWPSVGIFARRAKDRPNRAARSASPPGRPS
jgi:tRNA (adenine37-N6)-methyltransferase